MSVVITGAGGGIGRAVVARMAGRHVVGQDVRPLGDGVTTAVVGDLGEPGTRDRLRAALPDEPLDAVVLAHGIAGAGRLSEIGADEAARIMAVNFESVVHTWETLRAPIERSGATTVVVSSQAGLVAERDNGVYCASKSALLGWTAGLEALGVERLRVVCPGATDTPLLREALTGMADAQHVTYEEVLARRNAAVPAGRTGTTEEIAATICWLAALTTPARVCVAATGGEVLA